MPKKIAVDERRAVYAARERVLGLLRVGWWGIPGKAYSASTDGPKAHLVLHDGAFNGPEAPFCGTTVHPTAQHQFCAAFAYLPYVECERCKALYRRLFGPVLSALGAWEEAAQTAALRRINGGESRVSKALRRRVEETAKAFSEAFTHLEGEVEARRAKWAGRSPVDS